MGWIHNVCQTTDTFPARALFVGEKHLSSHVTHAYCLLFVMKHFFKCLSYLVRLLYVITCKLCSEYLYRVYVMLCYVILCLLCYAMVGCCVVPCPKNFSTQSDPVSFCASDNKRLVTHPHIVTITHTYTLNHTNTHTHTHTHTHTQRERDSQLHNFYADTEKYCPHADTHTHTHTHTH